MVLFKGKTHSQNILPLYQNAHQLSGLGDLDVKLRHTRGLLPVLFYSSVLRYKMDDDILVFVKYLITRPGPLVLGSIAASY